MTAGGVLFLTMSWAVIIGFNVLCLARLFSIRNRDSAPKGSGPSRTSAAGSRAPEQLE